jgi:hypothetical protein
VCGPSTVERRTSVWASPTRFPLTLGVRREERGHVRAGSTYALSDYPTRSWIPIETSSPSLTVSRCSREKVIAVKQRSRLNREEPPRGFPYLHLVVRERKRSEDAAQRRSRRAGAGGRHVRGGRCRGESHGEGAGARPAQSRGSVLDAVPCPWRTAGPEARVRGERKGTEPHPAAGLRDPRPGGSLSRDTIHPVSRMID